MKMSVTLSPDPLQSSWSGMVQSRKSTTAMVLPAGTLGVWSSGLDGLLPQATTNRAEMQAETRCRRFMRDPLGCDVMS